MSLLVEIGVTDLPKSGGSMATPAPLGTTSLLTSLLRALLLGSGGSILGIGNDIGGSVRNPAIFNGIYSLKPTHGRHLSQQGVSN